VDVVKQRMQIAGSPYRSALACAKEVLRKEGLRAFYVSYPTTVMMAIPQTSVHFAVYESLRTLLGRTRPAEISFANILEHVEGAPEVEGDEEIEYAPWKHVVAGCGAGAAAAITSNPLDVIKTRLQTQSEFGGTDRGFMDVAKRLIREEGWSAFMRGSTARVLYFAPSAALAWTSYEWVKWLLL
jgi:solute carrier family 25 iron transporter 28/37